MISTQIEIGTPPEKVRAVLLDFPKIPEWSHSFIKSIEPSSSKTGNIEKGDQLKVVLDGATFSPVVLENSSDEFRWRGSLFGLFTGEHSFRFEPSPSAPGSTVLRHSEEFGGILAFLMGPTYSFGKKTKLGFEKFNEELKERCEQSNS